jgi:hypothetical protein
MKRKFSIGALLTGVLLVSLPALAQTPTDKPEAAPAAAEAAQAPAPAPAEDTGRPITMQYSRSLDQRGVNVFETTKTPGAEFTGFKLEIGGSFSTQVQSLKHSNTAEPKIVNGVNVNQLMVIGGGFNNSVANLTLQAQLARGLRMQLTSYLSSRHHNETWVKDGYLQLDESPFEFVPLQALMQIVTIRAGQMEINYGDAHFRRSDNGNGMYNPFIGNYILEAQATEVAAEGYLKTKGIIAMAAVTNGESRGSVLTPEKRSLAKIAKLGVDRALTPDLRVRVTGSVYKTGKSNGNTLYGGDRAGSRYGYVLENTAATETGNAFSGTLNPGFRNEVTALVVNPFVKFRGLEVFGNLERSSGRASTEPERRVWTQLAGDVVYRFLPREQLFVGARYNRVEGPLATSLAEIEARRTQVAVGWFMTRNVLIKAEYVDQVYKGFPASDIKHGGKFHGAMLEGAIGF